MSSNSFYNCALLDFSQHHLRDSTPLFAVLNPPAVMNKSGIWIRSLHSDWLTYLYTLVLVVFMCFRYMLNMLKCVSGWLWDAQSAPRRVTDKLCTLFLWENMIHQHPELLLLEQPEGKIKENFCDALSNLCQYHSSHSDGMPGVKIKCLKSIKN